jgi:hypothetical protein
VHVCVYVSMHVFVMRVGLLACADAFHCVCVLAC